ncbi:MAG: CehA/McbA family metallohydrolase [Bryobacterales bacterium]|nr:CehA/McbA family metallohydrolase [Bryobacterales bacterium]
MKPGPVLVAAGLLALPLLLGAHPREPYPAARHGGNYMHNYYIPPAPSSTPWAPCWSPDGKWIAVAMSGSIWRVNPETGEADELTYNARYHSSPAWSPDGKWIVYTADDDGRSVGLEIVHVESGQWRPLTEDGHIYLDPTFSPDGRWLAYVSTRPSGYFNIFVRALRDGKWDGPEIPLTADHRYARDRLYFGPWDMHLQPAWTRDSSSILFLSNRGIPLGSGDLWRMPVKPFGLAEADRVLSEQTLYRTRPDVSPDGKRLVYSSTRGAAHPFHALYLLPVAGGEPYKLTFGAHDHFHPRWSPDGERIAYISNQEGLPQLALLEAHGGKQRIVRITRRRWRRPMGRLQVRLVDERGKPVPARVWGLAADGKFYAPEDGYARVGASGTHYVHARGLLTVEVPPGPMTVYAARGFEYEPASAQVKIEANQTAATTLVLRRILDLSARGWHSGSTHVHMNYSGNLHNTLENLLFLSEAEDQDFLNVLAANKDNRVLDYEHFVPGGEEHPLTRGKPGVRLLVGQEYRPPFYGHVFLLGLKEHLISPFTTGYEGTAIESLYPSNTDILRKARSQGAVTGYVHAFAGDRDPLEADLGVAKALPVDAALGVVDALEWSAAGRGQLRVWHHLRNNDLPIAPCGGEDSITDLHLSKVIGSVRTYAYLGRKQTVEAWLEAIRAGRTFMSTGPLVLLRVGGRLPGEDVQLPPEGGQVEIEAEVRSAAPLRKAVIHRNGEEFLEIPLAPDGRSGRLRRHVPVAASSWFSLYAEGDPHPAFDAAFLQAVTNAVRVYVGRQPIRNRASAEYFVRWMDKLRRMAEQWPWWRSGKERAHVLAQFEEATRLYERLAAEATDFGDRLRNPKAPVDRANLRIGVGQSVTEINR